MTGPQSTPPLEVQLSTLCWVGAVAAGGVESILGATEALRTDSASGIAVAAMVAIRAVVYTGVLWVASQLWLGRNWARWTLAIGLGIGGMATLLAGPVNPGTVTVDAVLVGVRAVQVVAVVMAVLLMFRPRTGGYFRQARRSRHRHGVVPA